MSGFDAFAAIDCRQSRAMEVGHANLSISLRQMWKDIRAQREHGTGNTSRVDCPGCEGLKRLGHQDRLHIRSHGHGVSSGFSLTPGRR